MGLAIPNNRIINIGVFLATVTTIGIALYLEHVMLFSPCGLCITQRVFFILCGLVCLASAIHNPTADGQKIYAFAAAAMCIFGSYFAGRQIWLQHLPKTWYPPAAPASLIFATTSRSCSC